MRRDPGDAAAVLTQPVLDVEEFDLSDDGAVLAIVVNQRGASRLLARGPAQLQDIVLNMKRQARPDLLVWASSLSLGQDESMPWQSGVISGLAFRPGSHELGFTLAHANAPADSYSFTFYQAGGSTDAARWTTSETGGLDTTRFPVPERIEYPTFDGRKIPAFVYRPSTPSSRARARSLIDIHGGPEGQFRPGFLGRLNYLVERAGHRADLARTSGAPRATARPI